MEQCAKGLTFENTTTRCSRRVLVTKPAGPEASSRRDARVDVSADPALALASLWGEGERRML